MNRKFDRCAARKVIAASISAMGLVAVAPAMAQGAAPSEEVLRLIRPESEVTVGAMDVSKGRYQFGDYNGMQKSGGRLIGDVRINRRGEDSANYLDVTGSNLGLDSRNLRIQGGEQGNFGLSLEYDQIHKLWSDSYQTPYLGAGSTNLTLPAGWVSNCATTAAPGVVVGCGVATASASTGLMPNLVGSMQSFNIETQRKSLALGLTKLLPGDWDVGVNFKHETKQGNRLIGGVFGTSGGNPRAAVLPEPVDYITRQFDVIARYTTDKLQVQLTYFGSLFDNKKQSLVFQNAYANGASTWGNAAVGYPNGFGQIGLPPDNQAHQIGASLGYMFTKDTRVAGNLSIGRNTQNESFLPYTVNAGLTSPIALPRSSLNGKVLTTHLDMKLTSKLTPKLNLVAAYRLDDRSNKTPQALYNYIGGDAANQVAAGAASDRIRYNLPGSSKKQQVDVELDYRLTAHTKVKVGYEADWVKKTFEAISSEREQTLKGDVHHHFSESTSGGVSYANSKRMTSSYDASAPFFATFTPAFIGTMVAGQQWDNNPFQRKFFLAPRIRDKARAFLNFEPIPKLDVQLAAEFKGDNYIDSYYGLKRTRGLGEHFDANYVVSDALTVRAFVSADQTRNFEKSNTLSAGCGGGKANPTAPGCEWGANLTDRGLTAGFGMKYKPAAKYELGFDYTQAAWTGQTVMNAAAALTQPTALPDNTTKLHRIDLFGRYELEKDLAMNVKYIYERYRSTDWAIDGVLANTMANVIGTNQTSPNYSVHAIGVSLSYQFR